MIAVDLFCGAGGLSEGLEQSGINVVVANEFQEHAALTYGHNHPDTHLIVKDIRKLEPQEITEIAGKDIDLVCGGPPCAGFSMLGKRNPSDPRNLLFAEFVRMVKAVMPSFFLMENVEGILSMQNGKTIQIIEKSFSDIGYNVSRTLINASKFGVPQARKRVFVFGSIGSGININEMTTRKFRQLGVADAISDLDFLRHGESSGMYLKKPRTNYQKNMRRGARKLYNHQDSHAIRTNTKKDFDVHRHAIHKHDPHEAARKQVLEDLRKRLRKDLS